LFERDRPIGPWKPLPTRAYVYAEWKQCKAGLDYHVEVEKHYYSVPHALLRETLWARITARTIELFHQSNRGSPSMCARHPTAANDRARTYAVQPPALCRWTPERIQRRANEIGRRHRVDRDHSARANASGARLPRFDRYPAARLQLRP